MLLAAAPATTAPQPTITVTGVRIETLAADLARCIAERCPPRQDIIATVRYAEGLFRTGRYQDAKRVLAKSVGRNKGAAASDPLVVSELYLAQANVARHEGDQSVQRAATFMRARVLKDALPDDTPAVLLADMSLADQAAALGPWRAASRYAALASRARAANRPTIAAAVTLRQASLAEAMGRRADARRLLDEVAASPGEALAGYRLAARALSARWARSAGDDSATASFLAAVAREPRAGTPVLLWSPEMPTPADPTGLDFFQRRDNVSRATDLFSLGWIDVGFLIRPDGIVEEPEVLRGKARSWAAPVLKAVAGRRYAPFGEADGAGQYRVERFTLTADYDTPIGSHVRRRMRNPRIERMDITGGESRKLG